MPETITPTADETCPAAVQRSRDGRRTFPCPPVSAGEFRCRKLYNPDPEAPYDFWFMLIAQRVGEAARIEMLVPLTGGGFRRFLSRVGYKNLEKVESLETFKAKTDDFGFVRIEKTEARKDYLEIRHQIFRLTTTVQDFDSEGLPISEKLPTADPPWPDLPGDGAELRETAPSRSDVPPTAGVIHFPTVVATDDGDYEVADGEVLPAGSARARTAAARPAIWIEVLQREGVPAAIVNDYFRVDDAGIVRRLYGDRCVQKTHIRIMKIIEEEHDRGFFRTRQKLTVIRKKLRIDDLTWEDT